MLALLQRTPLAFRKRTQTPLTCRKPHPSTRASRTRHVTELFISWSYSDGQRRTLHHLVATLFSLLSNGKQPVNRSTWATARRYTLCDRVLVMRSAFRCRRRRWCALHRFHFISTALRLFQTAGTVLTSSTSITLTNPSSSDYYLASESWCWSMSCLCVLDKWTKRLQSSDNEGKRCCRRRVRSKLQHRGRDDGDRARAL